MPMRVTAQVLALLMAAFGACVTQAADSPPKTFHLNEATIDDIHRGIRSGEVTCKQVVQAYVARARAYGGMCTQLVTPDGAKVPTVPGIVRAGAVLKFPTETVAVAKIFPDFGKYQGLPPDFGRMEATISDPAVKQQYGMVGGIPNARQVNGIENLNIRG